MHTKFLSLNLPGRDSVGDEGKVWSIIIKTDITEMRHDSVDWIQVARDRLQWREVVNKATNEDRRLLGCCAPC